MTDIEDIAGDIGLALNVLALAAPFVPGGGLLATIAQGAVTYGNGIKALIAAGTPIADAVYEHSPELLAAIKQLGTDMLGSSTDGAVVVAKKVFAPDTLTDDEQAWMDRASFNTGQ